MLHIQLFLVLYWLLILVLQSIYFLVIYLLIVCLRYDCAIIRNLCIKDLPNLQIYEMLREWIKMDFASLRCRIFSLHKIKLFYFLKNSYIQSDCALLIESCLIWISSFSFLLMFWTAFDKNYLHFFIIIFDWFCNVLSIIVYLFL